jgi:hypothetical protein
VLQIVDRTDQDDLETLTVISKLYFEGLIFDTGRRVSEDRDSLQVELDAGTVVPSVLPGAGASMVPSSAALSAGRALAAATAPGPVTREILADPRRTWDYGDNQESGAHERPQNPGQTNGEDTLHVPAPNERTLRGVRASSVAMQAAAPAPTQVPEAVATAPGGGPQSRALTPRFGETPQAVPNAVPHAVVANHMATLRPAAEPAETGRLLKTKRKPRRRRRASLITSAGLLSGVDIGETEPGIGSMVPAAPSQPDAREQPGRTEAGSARSDATPMPAGRAGRLLRLQHRPYRGFRRQPLRRRHRHPLRRGRAERICPHNRRYHRPQLPTHAPPSRTASVVRARARRCA